MKAIKSLKELQKIGENAFFGKNIINSDIEPTCPLDMRVVEHLKMGNVELSKLKLFYSKEQNRFGGIKGGMYRRSLMNSQKLINASILDWFETNPELIPESWKFTSNDGFQIISFFGTIYAHINGNLYVRTMFFNEKENLWYFGRCWIGDYWERNNPVVILID
jgi:hypothetical protein